MHGWVLSVEHILDGSWAQPGEIVRNKTVGSRLDSWREQMAGHLTDGTLSQQEQECLTEFLQVLSNLRPHLVQCYNRKNFPRTNNDMERSIRALKTQYRRIVGARIGTVICCAMDGAWHMPPGGNKIRLGISNWNNERLDSIGRTGVSCDVKRQLLRASNSSAFVSFTNVRAISLLLSYAGVLSLRRTLCPDGKKTLATA